MSSRCDGLVLLVNEEDVRLVCARRERGVIRLSRAAVWTGTKGKADLLLRHPPVEAFITEYVQRHALRGRNLLCLLGGTAVACHYYDLPPLAGEPLRNAALLRLRQQLHYDVAQAIVDVGPPVVRQAEAGIQHRVSVTAVPRAEAVAAADLANRLGLVLRQVTAAPAAISAYFKASLPAKEGLHGGLVVDEVVSTLAIFDGAAPCVTSELPIGGSHLTKALMRPIIAGDGVLQLTEQQARQIRDQSGIPAPREVIEPIGVTGDRLLPLLEPVLQQFARQIVQWTSFAATTTGEERRMESLHLAGPNGGLRGLAETLSDRLKMPVLGRSDPPVRVQWEESSGSLDLHCFTAVVGAMTTADSLPDLTPPEVRRAQRIRRGRQALLTSSVLATAALVALAVLLEQVSAPWAREAAARQQQLAAVRDLLEARARLDAEALQVRQVQAELESFAGDGPCWVGVFKELGLLLPPEVQALEYRVDAVENTLRLTLRGAVHHGRLGFDRIVEQTLLALQRSPFFGRVQLLAANRELAAAEAADWAGTLCIELTLVSSGKGT